RPFLGRGTAHRLARAYGTRVEAVLGTARRQNDLGRDFGAGLSEAEIDYLVRSEWVVTAEDILWRRSKLGLHLPRSAIVEIERYLEKLRPAATTNHASIGSPPCRNS
ncbi:MAG: hypothetical protein JO357_04585, partial [Hyphomicrobiales bacterium]|nr:hypothetical protein [Hyphomicrobiales bacterium]